MGLTRSTSWIAPIVVISSIAPASICGAQGQTINVTTVAQLRSAVDGANNSGGNRVIVLADGVYSLTDTLYVNVPNVTIRGQSGIRENVIIQGDAMSANASVKNLIRVAAANFTVQDLTLRRSGWHLIQIAGEAGGTASKVRNVVFQDAYEQMLKVSTDAPLAPARFSDNGLVEDSLFEYTAGVGPQYYIGGIDAHAARNWVVRNNTFRNIASPNTTAAEYAVHFWSSSADNLIENNVIVDCDRGIGFGMTGRPNSGGTIRNNMIYHANNGAPFADVAISLTESPNSQVYNNTVYTEHNFPWSIEYRFANTTGVLIANNLTNRTIQQRESASGVIDRNVTNAQASWFVSPQAGNLHLANAVPSVIDAGRNISGLTQDFDGQSRPQGAGPDIGADEYTSAVTPKAPTNLQVQ